MKQLLGFGPDVIGELRGAGVLVTDAGKGDDPADGAATHGACLGMAPRESSALLCRLLG